jgi:glycosyltransferase involved in cell wall biosynthesis
MSLTKPKISIVTATLNRKDYLPRCIEGVAGQSYPYKEHLIIDGGSTDGALDLLKSYAKKYPHIKWISEKDNGISSALNKGLAMATGDIIGVNGDDDFYAPGVFEIVAAEFAADPGLGVVSGNCAHINNNNVVWEAGKAGFTTRWDLIEYWRYWCRAVFLPAPSTFFRREVISKVGGFEEADRYAMDYHHWIKITEEFRVKTIDKVFATFRCDEGTVSFSSNKEQLAEMHRISRKYWGSLLSASYYRLRASYIRHVVLPNKVFPVLDRMRNSFKYRLGLLFHR